MNVWNGAQRLRVAQRWRIVAGAVVSVALACALAGTVPVAFAQEDGTEDMGDTESIESAFRLGRVAIECVDKEAVPREAEPIENVEGDEAEEQPDPEEAPDAPQGCELAMGEPTMRAYRIVNQGEEAYVRIASHTLLEGLDHVNGKAVTEQDPSASREDGGNADAEEKNEATATVPSESGEAVWRLARDGYWYRSIPLGANESITVYVAVEIPFEKEWIEALKTGQPSAVEETISVEALQSRNKTIDLSAKNPWGIQGRTLQANGAADENGGA